MELSFQSIALAIFFIVTLAWTWKITNWLWWRPKKLERCLRQQGIKGNPYRFLVGDLKEEGLMVKQALSEPIDLSDDFAPRILFSANKSVKNNGKDSFIWMGPIPRMVIMKPEWIRDVLTKLDEFQKKSANPLVRLLATGLASYNGQKWAKHRKLINPAFRFEKLKSMIPAIYLSCNEMMDEWETLLSSKDGGSCSYELDVWPRLENLTSDVISRTAFGISYKEGRKIFQLQGEQGRNVMITLRSVYLPGWRYLPTKLNKRMKEIDSEVQALLRSMIDKREKAMKAGERANDLLGIFIESNLSEVREHGGNKNMGISIQDVIEECKLFYFAGKETTSVLLVWTIVMLGKHKQWQTRAREEVRHIFGNNKPDYDGLGYMKVVTMILYEVLRLFPPIINLQRTVHEDTTLGELWLPKGVQISLPIVMIHRDRDLWGQDAGEFKPERFSEGILKATKGQASFFPFGWGPRICIGQNFALLEAKMALALILQRFEFELSPSYAHAPFLNLTLQPLHGARIILRKVDHSQGELM